MKTVTVNTHWARIYTSGPMAQAEQICRKFCLDVGLCVTVEPTRFIYTGGEEAGCVVGLINYPRFETSAAEIDAKAIVLASALLDGMHQHSVLIMTPSRTIWTTKHDNP